MRQTNHMEYSEELISNLLQELRSKGYTDTVIIDHGMLFAINQSEYYPLSSMKEDKRVNIYDEFMSGSAWSMHAITLNNSCKGILILGGDIYNPWELTSEIRDAFNMPLFSSDSARIAA